jgi:hypothetical protein
VLPAEDREVASGEGRRGARGGGGAGFDRKTCDGLFLERGGATHGRVTAWAITHKDVCRGAECGRGYQEREASKKRMEGSEREARVSCSSDRPGGARCHTARRRCVAGRSKAGRGLEVCGAWRGQGEKGQER